MPERIDEMRRIGLVPAIALGSFLLGSAVRRPMPRKSSISTNGLRGAAHRWGVERLTDAAEVVDRDGAKVGEVEDPIVGPDGKL